MPFSHRLQIFPPTTFTNTNTIICGVQVSLTTCIPNDGWSITRYSSSGSLWREKRMKLTVYYTCLCCQSKAAASDTLACMAITQYLCLQQPAKHSHTHNLILRRKVYKSKTGTAKTSHSLVQSSPIVNPRRACAARVTVLSLSVCLSTTILTLQATKRNQRDTNYTSATSAREIKWQFC